jgi:hypothetical protein
MTILLTFVALYFSIAFFLTVTCIMDGDSDYGSIDLFLRSLRWPVLTIGFLAESFARLAAKKKIIGRVSSESGHGRVSCSINRFITCQWCAAQRLLSSHGRSN